MSIEGIKKFYAVPDESRIPKEQKDQVMAQVKKLEETLERLFPVPCSYGKCEVGQYSGLTIVDRLIDTDETTIGVPQGEAKNRLTKEADLAIKENCPLVLVGIYGTPRHLDKPEMNKAQLSDMSAIMMVQAAMDRVYSAHLPGAKYRAIDEDLTALWLDIAQHPSGERGAENFKTIYKKYFDDRERLICTLEKEGLLNTGNTKIELLSEADLYGQVWKKKGSLYLPPQEDFLTKCETIRPHILNYLISNTEILQKFYGENDKQWIKSEEDPDLWKKCQETIKGTDEYNKALTVAGWQGFIPPEMMKYYLEKFRCILGNATFKANDPKLLFHIATYLSSTLAKRHAGTLTEGVPAGSPIIRVPLVRPPTGTPPSFQSLVPLRTLPKPKGNMDKRLSSTNRAAWLSVAVQNANKLRLVDTSKVTDLPEESVIPVQIYVVGPDNGLGSYLVDTAIVLSDL
ncbi:MAG: hypothetical protein WC847_02575 [Candidatus Paceibacterota bacterium]|jgi:hypothetical protein